MTSSGAWGLLSLMRPSCLCWLRAGPSPPVRVGGPASAGPGPRPSCEKDSSPGELREHECFVPRTGPRRGIESPSVRIPLRLSFTIDGRAVSAETLYCPVQAEMLVLTSCSAELDVELRSAYLAGSDT